MRVYTMARTSIARSAGLVLSTLLFSIVCVEVALRVWTPDVLEFKAVRKSDPVLHHVLAPSASYTLRSREFEVEVRTNSRGMRADEIPDSASDAFRIMILGDSFVEGYGVRVEEGVAEQLERRIKSTGGNRAVTVLNCGVAGYSPILEYLQFSTTGVQLRPDLVILFYDMSDVQEDVLYAEDADFDSMGVPVRVHPSWPSFGQATRVPRGWLKTFLHEHSYLYSLTGMVLESSKSNPVFERGNIRAGRFMHTVDSLSTGWEEYFRFSFSFVRMTADLCKRHGIPFVLVALPRGHQVNDREWSVGRSLWGLEQRTYHSAIFGELLSFARQEQLMYLDMTPAFRAKSEGDLYFPIDGHWTARGHSVAADTLFQFLGGTGLLPE